MTDPSRPDRGGPTVLLAAGRREDDPVAVWAALLGVAREAVDRAPRSIPRRSRPSRAPRRRRSEDRWPGPSAASTPRSNGCARRCGRGGTSSSYPACRSGCSTTATRPLTEPALRRGKPPWRTLSTSCGRPIPRADIRDLGRSAQGSEAAALAKIVAGLQNDSPTLLAGTIARGFGGDPAGLARFITRLRAGLPPGTTIALRGSAVVGHRHTESTPFDGDGPGTSDLDVVAVGESAVELWVPEARLLGGINTLPLSDEASWVAPALDRARRQAQAVVRRPLSIQAMAGWFLDLQRTSLLTALRSIGRRNPSWQQ